MPTPERHRTERLADVLTRLMARANLTPAVLARRAGVSPGTITNLLRGHVSSGKPTLASPDMLKAIALGLATNGLQERDLALADQHYGELMAAIGYIERPSLLEQPPLPAAVQAALDADPDLEIEIAALAALRPEDAILVRKAIAEYRRRFVQGDSCDDATA